MEFWIQVAMAGMLLLSLLLHHSHNKKLNDLGDDVDKVKDLVQAVKK
jgi:hypothetical protein